MFEKEIKFIGDFCLNQVKYLGTHFTFQKVTATELHPAMVRYISAELDFMVYSDRQKLLQHSYFDYSGKDIAEHFKKIGEEIKKTKRIAFDDAKKLILQAVSFNANYVVRPNWSLSQLIYNDQDIVSIDELEKMLNYIYYYEHLKNVLLTYLSKQKIVQISKTEFDLVLKKIDHELIRSNTEQLIDNSLTSIGDFFNIGGVDRNVISPVAVEILLKEKSLFAHLLKLRKGISDTTKKKYTINAIKRSLYASEVVEEKEQEEPDSEITDENLGELAEKHAQTLDKAGVEEYVNLEEEEALLALYEEELGEISSEEENDFSIEQVENEVGSDELETVEEPASESLKEIDAELPDEESVKEPEKEIITEMIEDYFGDESPPKQKADEVADELSDEKESTEDVRVEKPSSIEDELLEVFEDLDSTENEELETSTIEPEIKEDFTSTPEIEEIATSGTEIAEEEIKLVEEIVLSEEDSVINEVEATTSSDEEEIRSEPEEIQTSEFIEDEEIIKERIREKDLFSYLSRKEMKKILSHIFLKDEEDFINTAEKIMQCHSYKEASDILKSVYSSYKISPYSKDAVNFTNAVSNYFRQA